MRSWQVQARRLSRGSGIQQPGRCQPPVGAVRQRHTRCWIWRGRTASRRCDCTLGGRAVMTGSGSVCAPRSEGSGTAGPERPCQAQATGRRPEQARHQRPLLISGTCRTLHFIHMLKNLYTFHLLKYDSAQCWKNTLLVCVFWFPLFPYMLSVWHWIQPWEENREHKPRSMIKQNITMIKCPICLVYFNVSTETFLKCQKKLHESPLMRHFSFSAKRKLFYRRVGALVISTVNSCNELNVCSLQGLGFCLKSTLHYNVILK